MTWHVYPVDESGHNVDGWDEQPCCWCGARPDPEEPSVIVHEAGRQA